MSALVSSACTDPRAMTVEIGGVDRCPVRTVTWENPIDTRGRCHRHSIKRQVHRAGRYCSKWQRQEQMLTKKSQCILTYLGFLAANPLQYYALQIGPIQECFTFLCIWYHCQVCLPIPSWNCFFWFVSICLTVIVFVCCHIFPLLPWLLLYFSISSNITVWLLSLILFVLPSIILMLPFCSTSLLNSSTCPTGLFKYCLSQIRLYQNGSFLL